MLLLLPEFPLKPSNLKKAMKKFKSIFTLLAVFLTTAIAPDAAQGLDACTPTSTTNGSRTILTFNSTTACDWTVPANVFAIDILVVGGGGGGGFERGGGGGGGGVAFSAALSVSPSAVHVVRVGAGGVASTSASAKGGDGGTSSFVRNSDSTTLVQSGGGGGGGSHNGAVEGIGDGRPGVNASAQVSAGGSGGGSSINFLSGSDRWFYRGGNAGTGTSNGFYGSGSYICETSISTHDNVRITGGGGGASATGKGGASGNQSPSGCNTFTFSMRPDGGAGVSNSISGSSITYGGGGGGADGRVGTEQNSYKSLGQGIGGSGGGGSGQQEFTASINSSDGEISPTSSPLAAQNGTDGLGGGGGGGITTAGRGGNGVVIISYAAIVFSSTTPAQDSTISANLNSTNSNLGIGLQGEDSGTTYLVSISATNMPSGSNLRLSNVTGGTASFGFPAMSTTANFTNLSFTVTGANIDTILGSLQIIAGSTGGNPTISISVTQSQTGLAYNSRNGHFYRAVTGTITRNNAASAAANVSNQFGGRTGYLVTITDDYENDFVASQIQNAQNIWIGASDTGTEGLWIWDQGPENGTVFWRAACVGNGTGNANSCGGASGVSAYDGVNGVWQNWSSNNNHNKWCGVTDGRQTNQAATEPNNAYGSTGEDFAVTNWNGGTNSYSVDGAASTTHSCWNDLDNGFTGSIGGYVIEWGDAVAFNNTFSRSFNVKFNQSITLVTAPTAGSSVSTSTTTFNATSSSSLALTYTSSDTSVCTVSSATAASGANVTVSLVSANTNCTITISQAGNVNFNAATSISRTFYSLYGRVVSCTGVGSLQNGGFENLPVTTSNVATANGQTDYVWHGYNGANNNEPRQFLFLGAANSNKTTKISDWNASIVGTDDGADEGWVEIQRQISGYVQNGNFTTGAYYDLYNPAPAQGNYFAELNAKVVMGLYQDIATIPGTTIRWSIKHRGRSFTGADVMKVRIGTTSTQAEQTSLQKKLQDSSSLWTTPTYANNSFTSVSTISDELDTGWSLYTGSYTVPTSQTTTRFIFESVSGAIGTSVGNYLDDIVFSPLIACPATFSVIKGRTTTINPFDLDGDGVTDSGDSYGWSDATISASNLSASAGTVTRTTIGGVANRGISYTAPDSTGTRTIDFTITNPDGDTSNSRLTINVIDDTEVRSLNTLPIDPQATSYNPKNMTITSGPTQVLACLNIASDNSGTPSDGVLRIDVGNIGSADSSFSASGNTVTISSDRSSAVNITGVLASVNTTLRTTTITRVSGGRLSGTYYIRIRSVPTSADLLNVTCSDAAASSTRTFTLRPMSVGRTRSVSVSLNKR